MARRLNIADPDFRAAFDAFVHAKREASEDVNAAVAEIIADVRARGDDALFELTQKFDRLDLKGTGLAVSEEEISAAEEAVDEELKEALQTAADRIGAYHRRQRPENVRFEDAAGVELGHRWTPVSAAGLYVPGGTANYPSSVLMNAIPAKVAGVKRVVMTVPAPDGVLNPLVLAAARLAGVSEIYRVGGAQAVAALAYGTESITPVDVIVGPGNAYVAAAKRQVFGTVGIDMIAGPSEILVIADADNDPDWIAADLLSQAEHDASSRSILITDDDAFADRVAKAIEAQLQTLERKEIAEESWRSFGAIIVVGDLAADAPRLADTIAPEHLEIATADPEALAGQVTHAGAIFLGRYTPEAIGDYVAGTNHVLPTARSARYASGLSVLDFMKRTSLVRCTAESLRALAPSALRLAEAEGLGAHARSVSIRLNL